MTRKQLEKIFEDDSCLEKYKENTALLGLNILKKYVPTSGVEAAEHDIIYAASIDEVLEAGLTADDAVELRNLNWMLEEEGDCFACFV